LLTARANSSRQNKNKKTGQRFGQRLRLLPIYNFMLWKHYSLSVNWRHFDFRARYLRNENKTKVKLGTGHYLWKGGGREK
jgi:hypothetical protein